MATAAYEKISNDDWVSVNLLFGITVGVAFNIQNLGGKPCRYHIGTLKPAVESNGFRVIPAERSQLLFVPAGEEEVWVRGQTIIQAEE